MRFTVPQFIDYEAKIVGPFTFHQFIYVGTAGAICFVIYFIAPSFFIVSCIFLIGGALAFAFLRIGGRSLAVALGNFLRFSISPKMFIWQKGKPLANVFEKEQKIGGDKLPEEIVVPKISKEGRLNRLSMDVETKKD